MGQLAGSYTAKEPVLLAKGRNPAVVLGWYGQRQETAKTDGRWCVVRVIAVRYGPHAGVQEGRPLPSATTRWRLSPASEEGAGILPWEYRPVVSCPGVVDEHAAVGDGWQRPCLGDWGAGVAPAEAEVLGWSAFLGGPGATCGQGEAATAPRGADAGEENLRVMCMHRRSTWE